MLGRIGVGLYRIHQLRRTASIAGDAYQAACRRLAQQLNIKRKVTVYTSAQIVSPISFGWLSPSVLIPETLALEQFELVAAHELAHVHRLDWLTNLFSHVVGAIFFFHPIYHLLNRKLTYLREQICDDWVIQLTGARKSYAQCLLDLVRHKERAIPLALGINQPSQLESRISAILKNNRRLDCQNRHRLLVVTLTLLLTGLPLLAMAQLAPLRTVQLPFFSQAVFGKSEKPADNVEKQKMKSEKEYKEGETIRVLDPSTFDTSPENRVFSGPQPGENLPPLKGTGIGGDFDEKTYDIIAAVEDKPLLLFLQDNSEVGIKGLYIFTDTVAPILDKVEAQLQIAVLFLSEDKVKLPEYFKKEVSPFATRFQFSLSQDGREGPGVYGLNRNVAQTVIIAKDGKVLHNFAFAQPMIYTDPHLLGAIAQAIDVETTTFEKLLNEESAKRYKETDLDDKLLIAKKFAGIREAVKSGKVSRAEATEWLEEMGITWEEGEKLLKKTAETSQKMGSAEDKQMERDKGEKERSPEARLKQMKEREGTLSPEARLKQQQEREGTRDKEREGARSPESRLKRLRDPEGNQDREREGTRSPEARLKRLQDREGTRDKERERAPSREELMNLSREEMIKRFDKDGDGKLNDAEGMAARRALANPEGQNRARRLNVQVKNPAEFKRVQNKALFSGPQPGEKLPPLKAMIINGKAKGKTFDVIAKANGQPLVLFLQDESRLGLRGLVGVSRLLAQIAQKSKKKFHIGVVFLGNTPDTLAEHGSKIVPHIPRDVLLGISPDGREGPGSYGLNRNVAQTVLIVKEGKVLYNFALAQPMLQPDPYVLGAVGALIGEKPATLQKWLNEKNPIIEIKNPTEKGKMGKMLLNGTVVGFDEMSSLLRKLPEEQKSTLIIESERDVLHEQIVKVMDIAKEVGIAQIAFAIASAEGKNPVSSKEKMRRDKDTEREREDR